MPLTWAVLGGLHESWPLVTSLHSWHGRWLDWRRRRAASNEDAKRPKPASAKA